MKLINKELQAAYVRAEKFASDPKLLTAFKAASLDTKLNEKARSDPQSFLQTRGVKIPKGLDVKFILKPAPRRPGPDFEFFTIRLYNCRSFWVKKKNEPGFEQVQICFGIEIFPNRIPGFPIG